MKRVLVVRRSVTAKIGAMVPFEVMAEFLLDDPTNWLNQIPRVRVTLTNATTDIKPAPSATVSLSGLNCGISIPLRNHVEDLTGEWLVLVTEDGLKTLKTIDVEIVR